MRGKCVALDGIGHVSAKPGQVGQLGGPLRLLWGDDPYAEAVGVLEGTLSNLGGSGSAAPGDDLTAQLRHPRVGSTRLGGVAEPVERVNGAVLGDQFEKVTVARLGQVGQRDEGERRWVRAVAHPRSPVRSSSAS